MTSRGNHDPRWRVQGRSAAGPHDEHAVPWWSLPPFLLLYWASVAGLVVGLDYVAGPYFQFPVLFVIPVVLASWYSGLVPGLAFSVVLPAIRLWFVMAIWTVPWSAGTAGLNALVRVVVLASLAYFANRTATQARALKREIRVLEGFLPICSFCKRIRDESEAWQPLESYISARSEAVFSHGVCPECARKHYGSLADPP
jgi:hypothetical protein